MPSYVAWKSFLRLPVDLPADLKARRPEIPWTDVAGAGSIYRHHYQDVRDTHIWRTVTHFLEPLRLAAEHELSELTR